MNWRTSGCLFSVVALALAGCGTGGVNAIPVHGTVRYQGKPLTSGTVRYVPVDAKAGRVATSAIAADGSYRLSTFAPGDGVFPGEYFITVYAADTRTATAKELEKGYASKSAIPTRYQDPAQSGLKEKIDGPRRIDIDLTGD